MVDILELQRKADKLRQRVIDLHAEVLKSNEPSKRRSLLSEAMTTYRSWQNALIVLKDAQQLREKPARPAPSFDTERASP